MHFYIYLDAVTCYHSLDFQYKLFLITHLKRDLIALSSKSLWGREQMRLRALLKCEGVFQSATFYNL